MAEWKYEVTDWSKETRCTDCRMPPINIKEEGPSYTPVTCRACKFIRIFQCKDCKDEIGFCEHPATNNPPTKDLDKKRKCLRYDDI